jgi:hypothetical protein
VSIHILSAGLPLCMFSNAPPAQWPDGHAWVPETRTGYATCEACKALNPGKPQDEHRYVLSRREMRALRDHWIDACADARRDGDTERADASFRCAVDWDLRSRA